MPTFEYIAQVRMMVEAVNAEKGNDWCQIVLEDVAAEVISIEEVR